jgi:DNA-directed RNA polymerase
MIPRAARRLETTLLSSRQSLPRPFRLYSTPTKRVNAPGLATVQVQRQDYPNFLKSTAPEAPLDSRVDSLGNELEGFLKRRMPYTILPTPLPTDRSSDINDFWYTDSPTQDLLAVMDACLHNMYDVPRAKSIFDRMREKIGNPALEPRVYNAFLEAYLNLATAKDVENKEYWVETAWDLYNVMESGREKIEPTASTYATMLLLWHR